MKKVWNEPKAEDLLLKETQDTPEPMYFDPDNPACRRPVGRGNTCPRFLRGCKYFVKGDNPWGCAIGTCSYNPCATS